MKKLFGRIISRVVAIAAIFVFSCSGVFADGVTPIKNLQLTTSANGNWYNFTNLNYIVSSNIVSTNILAHLITAQTGNFTNLTAFNLYASNLYAGTLYVTNMVSSNTYTKSEVDAMLVNSGNWNTAYVTATWSSNGVVTLNGLTTGWNTAYITATWSSNGVITLNGLTTGWNTASIEATWSSNGVIGLNGLTTGWNTASITATWASNGVVTLNGLTTGWNTAAIEATWASNGVVTLNGLTNNIVYLSKNNTYGIGTIQNFALATITNNATTTTDVVNYQTLTNAIATLSPPTVGAAYLASNNTYSVGTTQFLDMAHVMSNAIDTVDVVNYQTLTNYAASFPTSNWNTAYVYATNPVAHYVSNSVGVTVLDSENYNLIDADGITVDWSGKRLYDSTGVQSLDWNERFVLSGNGSIALSWADRQLYDINTNETSDNYGMVSVDWNLRKLYDGTTNIAEPYYGFLSINWMDRSLCDTGGNIVVQWQDGILKNAAGIAAYQTNSGTANNLPVGTSVSNATADTQPITLAQLRETIVGNLVLFSTVNKTVAFTNTVSPTNATYLLVTVSELPTTTLRTNVAGGVGTYISAIIYTNRSFTNFIGQAVHVELYCSENVAGSLYVKPEVYRYQISDGVEFEWGDAAASNLVATGATPQRSLWAVPVVDVITNEPFYLMIKTKHMAGSASELIIGVGSNYPSHADLTLSADVLLAGYTKADGSVLPTATWDFSTKGITNAGTISSSLFLQNGVSIFDVAQWASNTAYWASNYVYGLSNSVYGLPTGNWNIAYLTATWASNTAYWASNYVYGLSNSVYGLPTGNWNIAYLTATWASNTAYWASNLLVTTTNNLTNAVDKLSRFSFSIDYGVFTNSDNATNYLLWSSPCPYASALITNIGWWTLEGQTPTGNLYIADGNDSATFTNKIVFSNITFNGSVRSNKAVQIPVTGGQFIAPLPCPSTAAVVTISGVSVTP
jgi:hypothetical protein